MCATQKQWHGLTEQTQLLAWALGGRVHYILSHFPKIMPRYGLHECTLMPAVHVVLKHCPLLDNSMSCHVLFLTVKLIFTVIRKLIPPGRKEVLQRSSFILFV